MRPHTFQVSGSQKQKEAKNWVQKILELSNKAHTTAHTLMTARTSLGTLKVRHSENTINPMTAVRPLI
jgi:hypothetical protein